MRYAHLYGRVVDPTETLNDIDGTLVGPIYVVFLFFYWVINSNTGRHPWALEVLLRPSVVILVMPTLPRCTRSESTPITRATGYPSWKREGRLGYVKWWTVVESMTQLRQDWPYAWDITVIADNLMLNVA